MSELKNEQEKIFDDIEKELVESIEKEKAFNVEELKEIKAKKRNFILTVLEKMLGKLLIGLKIEIVVKWKEKVLFTYVIPKD